MTQSYIKLTQAMKDIIKTDSLIIGAGVIGLAIARHLALLGKDVIVLEQEPYCGSITSARNSGVIHAGIYYKPQSLKALLCVRGKHMLYDYARAHSIPFRNCGKIIVATNEEEITKLDSIHDNAQHSHVEDLAWLDRNDIKKYEPALHGVAGLYSPSTGIIDVHCYIAQLQRDIEAHNGIVATRNTARKISIDAPSRFITETDDARIQSSILVNAAGLGAAQLASRMDGLDRAHIPKTRFAKGHYVTISGAPPFSRLVYPVPVDGGLGAHYTMNMAGESLFGPDVEWLAEGSDPQSFDYDIHPERIESFYASIARYWPGVGKKTLRPAYAGIRPKLSEPGESPADFMIQTHTQHGINGLVNLYGIESPGITASLALAEHFTTLTEP